MRLNFLLFLFLLLFILREGVLGVSVGGILGHAICTGSAVIGGRLLASKISVRHVTLLGGVVFIIFAFIAIGIGPDEDDG